MKHAAIGLRAKTGRAIGVAVAGSDSAPAFVARRELTLFDPAVPDSGQPYHAVMELPWEKALIEVQPLVEVVERCAAAALKEWVDELRSRGFAVRAIGIVGAPERRLERIGNPHIRAHGAEGVLFRHALEVAAERNDLRYRTVAEKSLPDVVDAAIDKATRDLGRDAGKPWRADERAAAAMALLALR